jgi:hypothetical protein
LINDTIAAIQDDLGIEVTLETTNYGMLLSGKQTSFFIFVMSKEENIHLPALAPRAVFLDMRLKSFDTVRILQTFESDPAIYFFDEE